MRCNLVLCLDGTWNRADSPRRTNVALTFAALGSGTGFDPGHAFLRPDLCLYYDAGVGTGRFDRIRGGVLGLGLGRNVAEAYAHLVQCWKPGDRIFLFGYSRGAYTARSLAGLLRLCGLPPRGARESTDPFALARTAMACYSARDVRSASLEVEGWIEGGGVVPPIAFLGVWDTVGALGVPIDGLRWLGASRWRWHDVSLSTNVRRACHLLAIDERRRPFAPSLWRSAAADSVLSRDVVEQIWLPGVHSDVGGGGADRALSDRSLVLMWDRARAAGLDIDHGKDPMPAQVAQCRPGDSMTPLYRLLGERQRAIGLPLIRVPGTGRVWNWPASGEAVHRSALDLWEHSKAYRDSPGGRALANALSDGIRVVS